MTSVTTKKITDSQKVHLFRMAFLIFKGQIDGSPVIRRFKGFIQVMDIIEAETGITAVFIPVIKLPGTEEDGIGAALFYHIKGHHHTVPLIMYIDKDQVIFFHEGEKGRLISVGLKIKSVIKGCAVRGFPV